MRRLTLGEIGLATIAVAVATAMSSLAAEDPKAKPSGIYIEHGTPPISTNEDRIEPTVVTDTEMQGQWKMAIGGRPKMVSNLPGVKAERRLTDPKTTFLFVFPANGGRVPTMDLSQLDDIQHGLVMGTSSPKDYLLARLTPTTDARQVQAGKNSIKCDVESVSPRVFRIRPAVPLEPGEYAFFDKHGIGGKVWDFGVEPNSER
jgi:hypothetical protein